MNAFIIVWNVAEKKPAQTIEKKGWIRRVALTADGKNFAAGMEDGSVLLFETEGPKELKTFNTLLQSKGLKPIVVESKVVF